MNLLSVLESAMSLMTRGGWVLIPIFCLGWYAWFLTINRYFLFRRLNGNFVEKFWKTYKSQGENAAVNLLKKKPNNYFSMLAKIVMDYRQKDEGFISSRLEAKRHSVSIELSKSMRSISVSAAVAPLLGLLGTVSGMVHTFEIIEMFGFGNPVLLADGISEALLTTQAGLLVAFPLMLAYNYLSSRIEQMEHKVWAEVIHLESVVLEKKL